MPCRVSGDNVLLALFTKIHLQFVSPLNVDQRAEQLLLLAVAVSVACFVPALLIYEMGKNFFRHVFTVI